MPFETNVKCTDTQWELTKSYDPLKVHEKYIDIYIYIFYTEDILRQMDANAENKHTDKINKSR